jgi:hypothetical protein
MTPRCDYAGCSVIAVYPDDGWDFCWQHYCEHRADLYGEPWPTREHILGTTLGTTVDGRRHLTVVVTKAPANTGKLRDALCTTPVMHSGRGA